MARLAGDYTQRLALGQTSLVYARRISERVDADVPAGEVDIQFRRIPEAAA
jgi:hypothetical protein